MNSQILTFYSTHHALAAEKLLKANHIRPLLVPTPRELSSNCGIALRISDNELATVRDLLESAGIEVEGAHAVAR